MMLQAFFDDSGSKGEGQFMVLAGLFGEAEVFSAVSDDWDRHLRARHPGSIRYFKMHEACTLSGEFRHWQPEKRDEKIAQLAKVIDRDDLMEFAAVVPLKLYMEMASEWEHIKGRHTLSEPYMLLYPYVLSAVVGEASRWSDEPMEIIFDDQDLFRGVIVDGYNELREMETDPARRAVMPVQPWFRNDMDFVILQAADMLAGEARLLPEDSPMSRIGDLCPRLKATGHFKFVTENDLRALSAFIR